MRRIFTFLLIFLAALPAPAATPKAAPFTSTGAVLSWINNFRSKPEPNRIPNAYKLLSQAGMLKDPETTGIYLGFLAGAIARDPKHAETWVRQTLPLPFESQWILIRAIAFSGAPNWKPLLKSISPLMPERAVMIDGYLSDKLPTPERIALEQIKPGVWKRMGDAFTFHKKPEEHPVTFQSSPELLDALWGFYFASGDARPIRTIINVLPWSKDIDDVEKLTMGSMAKFTLATNAARDPSLLSLLRSMQPGASKDIAPVLKEVVDAAETMDTGRIHKDALAAIEVLKIRGPGSNRKVAWWGQVGETTLAAGCLTAALVGTVVLGIPCVVGGAVSSAAIRYWATGSVSQ